MGSSHEVTTLTTTWTPRGATVGPSEMIGRAIASKFYHWDPRRHTGAGCTLAASASYALAAGASYALANLDIAAYSATASPLYISL